MNAILDTSLVFTAKEMMLFKYVYPSMTLNEFILYIKSEMDESEPLLPSIIFDLCCQTTGIDILHAMSRNRSVEAVLARQLAMYFIHHLRPRMSSARIGSIVGGRDHATVLHGIKQINNMLDPIVPTDFRKKWFYNAKNRIEYRLGRSINV